MSPELAHPRPAAGPPGIASILLETQKAVLERIVVGDPLAEILADLTRAIDDLDADGAVAAILLLDGGRLWTGAAPALPDAYNRAIDGLEARADLGTCSAAAVTRQIVITPDIAICPRWRDLKALPLDLGLVAAWSQPILARDGRVLGTFGTYFRERRGPTELERQLVATLAHTAALAIERDESHRALLRQERFLDRALEAADMGVWRYDLQTHICELSPRAQALYGSADTRFLHDEAGASRLLHPEDIQTMRDAVRRAVARDGQGRYAVEYRTRRIDGGWRWLSVWGLAEFEGDGEGRRAVALTGASRDISERKAADQQQAMLVAELSHRVKNNLAIVQAMAAHTLRTTASPEAFGEAFMGRLAALSQAHSLLTSTFWAGASLAELAQVTLEPFRGADGDDALRLEGPDLVLPPGVAVTLALVLHELATNAAKYGALSAPGGKVELTWTPAAHDPSTVVLTWAERDGPAVQPPMGEGFGSRLLRSSARQLGGRVEQSFHTGGLRCELRFPLPGEHVDRTAASG